MIWTHSSILRLGAGASAALLASAAVAGTPAEDFASADADRSGALSKAEFRAFIGLAAAAGRGNAVRVRDGKHYDRAFARIDKNKDGQLSPVEMEIG